MTMVGKTLVGLTAASLLVAGPAFASPEVEEELAEMRQLVQDLKERVEAQEEQLEHQGGILEDAQRVVRETQLEDGTLSGVSEFWGAVDVHLSAAGSYAYNFHNPDGGGAYPGTGAATLPPGMQMPAPPMGTELPIAVTPGGGINGGTAGLYPFHGDHNSFQVDQVWLDIGKAPTDESRGGFMFTALFGNTARFLGQQSSSLGRDGPLIGRGADSASDVYVHQAYVSWLAPVGEGIQIDAGKFATIIGAETADASANWNITRGNVYQLLQPIDHTGALATTTAGPITIKGGVVNAGNLGNGSPDFNKEKSYLGSLGFGSDMFGVAVNVLYGAEGGLGVHQSVATLGDNSHREGLVDVVATLTTDGFEAWINADYLWTEKASASAYGIAVAGLVPLTDVFSVAARLEYARDDGRLPPFGLGVAGAFGPGGAMVGRHADIYSATGTLAYELAENLTLKGEVRWDKVNTFSPTGTPDAFFTNTAGGSQDQVVGLGQMIYAF